MINIFSSAIKSHSFEVFASLSLDKGLVILDMSKNILLLHEVNLSMSCCTISEANIIAFTSNSSSLSWPPDISKYYVTDFFIFSLGLLWEWCDVGFGLDT